MRITWRRRLTSAGRGGDSRVQVRKVLRRDREYPILLREIPDPPAQLFAAGLPLEPAPYVAVVGSRRASRYGLEVARWIAKELASSGVVVVSGMARGIDAAAHNGALEAGGNTIAILGCGLDICYPRSNRLLYETILGRGTLIGEHELGTRPLPYHFPSRNRVIAGMSLGVVIVEGRHDGGAMITARLAMEYNREVFAVAGPVHSPLSMGPHLLVRQGARLVTSAADILEDLGMLQLVAPETPEERIEPDEAAVLKAVSGAPALLDMIAEKVAMPASTTSSILAKLEVKGMVSRHPGGRFGLSVGAPLTAREK